MNKLKEEFEDIEIKLERLARRTKVSKTKVQNIAVNGKITFEECVFGTGKIVSYDLIACGQNPSNIVVKLDNVVVASEVGLMAYGEFLLKNKKLYNLCIECLGDGLISAKLRLESADLKML